MIFSEITESGAIPVLEASMRFAARRQPILAANLANIETPDFRPMDVSVKDFQKSLAAAIEARRAVGDRGALGLKETREVRMGPDGSIALRPGTASPGVLFHDRNNRDLEHMMQDLVENSASFRVASEFLRTRYDLIRSAIGQRV